MALGFLVIGVCFAAVTILAGILGIIAGVPIFGGMPAPKPLPPMPEINPAYRS